MAAIGKASDKGTLDTAAHQSSDEATVRKPASHALIVHIYKTLFNNKIGWPSWVNRRMPL